MPNPAEVAQWSNAVHQAVNAFNYAQAQFNSVARNPATPPNVLAQYQANMQNCWSQVQYAQQMLQNAMNKP